MKNSKPRNPLTRAEWQEAVDAAEFFRMLDSAEQYGLVGGPKVDAARCREILERGAKLGITPAPQEELIRRFLTTETQSALRKH